MDAKMKWTLLSTCLLLGIIEIASARILSETNPFADETSGSELVIHQRLTRGVNQDGKRKRGRQEGNSQTACLSLFSCFNNVLIFFPS